MPAHAATAAAETRSNRASREGLPRRRKPARRSEILAAARACFAAHPYDEASISGIAAAAGCVEGTIYTYFRNKRELFDAVLADFFDGLVADVEPHIAAIEGTRERLRFLIARHLRIALDDPGLGALVVREARSPGAYFGSKLHALNRRYSRYLLETLEDGVRRGELRPDLDPAMARDLIFGGLEHWTFNERGRQRSFDPAAVAERLVALLLDGWAPDAQAAPVAESMCGADPAGADREPTGSKA